MQLKLNKVKVGARELPVKCDCYVLAQLQQEYGSITAFENKLRGYEIVTDEDGRPLKDDDGRFVRERRECDIGAVIRLLTLCVEEGMDIAGEEPLDEKEVVRAVKNPFALVVPLLEEFYRAFDQGEKDGKKQPPSRSKSR